MQLTAQCAQINLSLDVAVVSLKEGIQHLEVTRLWLLPLLHLHMLLLNFGQAMERLIYVWCQSQTAWMNFYANSLITQIRV